MFSHLAGALVVLLHLNLFVFTPTSAMAIPPSASRNPAVDMPLSTLRGMLDVSETNVIGSSGSADGVQIVWTEGSDTALDHPGRRMTSQSPAPWVEIGGYRLPARLITLAVNDNTDLAQLLAGTQVESEGAPETELIPVPARVPTQIGLDGSQVTYPDLATPPPTPTLPQQPLVLVREGHWRGQRVAVLALTSIFEQAGERKRATRISALLPGTHLLSLGTQQGRLPSFSPKQISTLHPSNAMGLTDATAKRYRMTVLQVGMQQLTGQALQDVGIGLAGLNPDRVQVWWQGKEVAVHWLGGADGQIDPTDALRFYAGQVGDRWNATETFWLTVSDHAINPKQMQVRSVGRPTAPLRTQALERGVWRKNQVYNSLLAGPDGDHWFAAQLTPESSEMRIGLNQRLPLVTGMMSMTLLGSTYVMTRHTLTVRAEPSGNMVNDGSASPSQVVDGVDVVLNGIGDWQQPFTLQSNQSVALIKVAAGSAGRNFLLDGVAWERPVALDFGGRGAMFAGVAGLWTYQLANAPVDSLIYDVTDLLAPVVIGNASTRAFEAGPQPAQYLLSGTGTVFAPILTAVQKTDLNALTVPTETAQIYIAPADFMPMLQPLLDLRVAQQRPVVAVDVQAIYDVWSGGQVSPSAIRQYLQAMAQLAPDLQSVALVGDGSYDPLDYLGTHLPTLIPPYLARVDPDIGETACETCYGQLDESDALAEPLVDIAVGRLPVKTKEELNTVVQKIVGYETAPVGAWQWRSTHVADNYRDADNVADDAGNFPAYAEAGAWLEPTLVDKRRLYFDPYLPSAAKDVWREPNPLRAHEKVLSMFDEGAAVVGYQGHGLETRWAFTANTPDSTVNYLLDKRDIAGMTNGTRLPVVIEMACLTGAFHEPNNEGATIDETLLLAPNGGAIATWGSTGYGLAYQHEYLQAGFYRRLWQDPGTATLGELTLEGLNNLYTGAGCCLDAMQTYALQGDPMTRVRVMLPMPVFMPGLMR